MENLDNYSWRIHLPYQLRDLGDGRYILLNRVYKPLGWPSDNFVDYDTHPSAFSCSTAAVRRLRTKGIIDDAGYLYFDGTSPRLGAKYLRALLDKVAVIARLKITQTRRPTTRRLHSVS